MYEVWPAVLVRESSTQLFNINLFARYMRQILHVLTDFQVSERLHGGPKFLGNYLIDYLIGYIIITP